METKHHPKSSTGQDTRSLGTPFVHVERDPAVFGLRRVDEVIKHIFNNIVNNAQKLNDYDRD